MTQQGTVTLADVARHAGVSLTTASRVLNGSARKVRPDSEARVAASAAALHYSPNVQAQAVARGTTTTVALVVGDIADPYFAQIAAGAMRESEVHGLVLTLAATNGDPDREDAALRSIVGLRPRVVVLAASRRDGEDVSDVSRTLAANGASVVVLLSDGAAGAAPDASTALVVENRAGARALAGALVAQGHRSFGLLEAEESLLTSRTRVDGFVAGVAEHSLQLAVRHRVSAAFTRDGGHAAMLTLLDRPDRPDCVFAVNDVMAVGAIAAVRERGLEPGRDIGIAGFDDIRTLADVTPAISTVRLPLEEIGAAAVRSAITGDPVPPVAGTVVLRASTTR